MDLERDVFDELGDWIGRVLESEIYNDADRCVFDSNGNYIGMIKE